MPKIVRLDGTHLEGGGQLLRLATTLSALTSQPVDITDIRGKRSGGSGLKLQHLTCVQWLSRASGAPTRGAEKKSKVLEFWSRDHDAASLKVLKGIRAAGKMDTVIDVGSPGAVGLVFQAILPYVLFSGAAEGARNGEMVVHITIKGGTNVSHSPSVDYLQRVLCPMLEKIGLPEIEVRCGSRGWSTGRSEIGAVTFAIKPLGRGQSLRGFELKEQGEIVKIKAVVLGPRASEKTFHRELKEQLNEFKLGHVPLDVEFELSGHEKRLYLLLVVHTSTGLRLGRDHLFQERFSTLDYAVPKVVQRAVKDIKTELDHGGCVDEFMRDQLVVFQTLAKGKSEVVVGERELSLHAQTAQWVVNEMLGVDFDENGGCDGVGWVVGEPWRKRVDASRAADELGDELQALNKE
jgi:RNA 3'-terminal phosphate cyclase (ATP)